MTTYELPPEPPIGSQLRDPDQNVWERTHDGWTGINYAGRFPWSWIMARSPLTLIEPDPWPTEPLIVATLSSPSRSTKRLLLARNSNGDYVDGVRSALQEIDALTNVVPVTVVPTAEWQALGEKVRGFDTARTEKQRRVVVTRAAELLIEATNALGLD
ncbi:MAG: hypothetical protein EOL90_13585 [Spartobacteria bacterium]|nr:hypothetical protein [Spartobacteria bacterium]